MSDVRIEQMARERRAAAERLNFADASLWLGTPPSGFPLAREVAPEAVGSMWRESFVATGLVSHWVSKEVAAQDANRALVAALPRLPPDCRVVWTGLPLLPGEAEPAPGVGRDPERLGGVRIFPKSHAFPLAEWALGSLCRWMVARRLPLFIWHTELDWTALWSLARAFPKLPIVVESQPQKLLYHLRSLFPLLGSCANVYVETSNFVGQGAMEYTVRHFGAERLIFGTFLPVGDPLVPIGMLVDAEVPEADKALIAGGNLRRLLSEVQR